MKKEEMQKVLQSKADEFGFEGKILEAIITVESEWKPLAIRYEKGFPFLDQPEKFAKLNGITASTETVLQQMSFSISQLMGCTCRGLGYSGPLTGLLDPVINIHWAAVFFKKNCDKYESLTDKIAAYNAGTPKIRNGVYSNQTYVDKVMKVYDSLEKS